MENKKILILVLPFTGHTNPVISITQKLVKQKAQVIFFSRKEFKEKIDRAGAEFREYPNYEVNESLSNDEKTGAQNGLKLMQTLMKIGDEILPFLVKVVEDEKPDLIIYDILSIPAMYLMKYLRTRFKQGKSKIPAPPGIFFLSTFAFKDNVYPDEELITKLSNGLALQDIYLLYEELNILQNEINQRHGFEILDAAKYFSKLEEKMAIVTVFPELQPKLEAYEDAFKFVGCCVSEIRKQDLKNSKVKAILDQFKAVNPVSSVEELNTGKLKLVYVSLGTIFNNNFHLFEHIINGFKTFDDESEENKSDVRFSDLRIIISVGKLCYESYKQKIEKENYLLPNNILMLPTAPQIDILERASLFITHCGMNSTSEAIYYGVPVVALPLDADQPFVAYRICDELQLGKKLNFIGLTPEKVRQTVHETFRDKTYAKNMLEFSKISRSYNGVDEACQLIKEYMEDNPIEYDYDLHLIKI